MKPIGYSYLNKHYSLLLPKLGLEIYHDPLAESDAIIPYGASKRKVLSKRRKIADTPYDNMVAAIQYQGIRLHFFAAIFKKVNVQELADFIKKKPNAMYNRVLWFLYEWLTGEKLPLPDLSIGNYIPLFDDTYYYTNSKGERNKRTRILNNAIGTKEFCPTIRKTPKIKRLELIDVYKTAHAHMQSVGDILSQDVIGRSVNYLYTKETKSSTEIEREPATPNKMKRFLNAMKNAGLFELSKEKLIAIKNQIIEAPKRTEGYREDEIYVGTTIHRFGELDEDVHYIGPLAKHVDSLMRGLLDTHERLMMDRTLPSLMHATLISFGLVYIHPFEDGNGRTHRYLIHDVMKQREPEHQFIIPISVAILKNESKYNTILESISKPIMSMLDWYLDRENNNRVVINSDIDYMYRYPDYSEHVIFTYEMMETAIAEDLMDEICLLLAFDNIKKFINETADIPNLKLDTIVSILINGNGKISNAKQEFVANYLPTQQLSLIEEFARRTLEAIKEKSGIDVSKVLRNEISRRGARGDH